MAASYRQPSSVHKCAARTQKGFPPVSRNSAARLQADDQGDGLLILDQQRWQRGARGQLVAALGAALGRDRVTQLTQPVDVPAQGARRNLQPSGQFRTGQYRRACSSDSNRSVRLLVLILAMSPSSGNSGQEVAAMARSVGLDR